MLEKIYNNIRTLLLKQKQEKTIIEKNINDSYSILSFSDIKYDELEYMKKIKYHIAISIPVYTVEIRFNKRESDDSYYVLIKFTKYNVLGKSEKDNVFYPTKKNTSRPIIINENLTMYSIKESSNNFIYEGIQGSFFPTTFSELSKLLNMFEIPLFKDIICTIFYMFSKKHILFKDIAKEYKEQNIYLPIKINEISSFYNKKDLIQNHCKLYSVPKNINKYPLQLGYLLVKCRRYVEDKDYQKLLYFFKDFTSYDPKYSLIRNQVEHIFYLYYMSTIKKSGNTFNQLTFEVLLKDYIYMNLTYTKSKIFNLKIKSANRIIQEHNNLMYQDVINQTSTIKIPKNSKFNKLKLPDNFERITNKKRLIKESTIQHNCVAGYADYINKDFCAIYSTIYKNKRYTIEIIKERKDYILKQIYGIANTIAPQELVFYIENILKEQQSNKFKKGK